ncbi:MAG: hypothetical protein AAGC43_10635 [Bacteroidota bacterium]
METPYDKIRRIEDEYEVKQIRYKGESYWPLFRSLMLSEISFGKDYKKNVSTTGVFEKVTSAFFGFLNWFRKYDYIAFSNHLEQKYVDGAYIDKLLEKTITELGHNRVLYIENTNKHLKNSDYRGKRVVSWNILLLLIGVVSKINFFKTKLTGEAILEDIITQEGLAIRPEVRLRQFLAKTWVLHILFKIYRPKCVFLTDYGYYPMTFAAKKLSINTVEYQHGIIGKVHPFYHPKVKLNPTFCPNYLFVFGEYDKQSLSDGNYVSSQNIFPVGNFYLEYVLNRKYNPEIVNLVNQYRASICIPTNILSQEFLLSFVHKAALQVPDVIFILVPRDYGQFSPLIDQIEAPNVHVENKHTFQEVVRHCTFNSSTISTCNLEAISLGVQNILIEDSTKLTKKYYGELLSDTSVTKFVETVDEYVECINTFKPIEKERIINSNDKNYMPNYPKNLILALNKILN